MNTEGFLGNFGTKSRKIERELVRDVGIKSFHLGGENNNMFEMLMEMT